MSAKPVHPACDIFPLMSGEALDSLAADIRANGLNHPIVLHEGQIVDGRNRLLACQKANIEPQFVQWRAVYKGDKSLVAWIWSENVERRHLTKEQIGFAIVARMGFEKTDEARQRQEQGRKHGGEVAGKGRPKPDSFPPDSGGKLSVEENAGARHYTGETRVQLAKEAGVSKDLIQRALNVQKAPGVGPELVKAVAQGSLTVRQAEEKAGRAPMPKPAPPPPPATALQEPDSPREESAARRKYRETRDAAAKRRMVEALSHINGFCRGLAGLDVSGIRRSSSEEELATWAVIARNAAKALRLFSSSLALSKEESV